MKKFTKIVKSEVQVETSHLWIIALGTIIALGFGINCLVAPFYAGCTPIDETELILSASIVAGLGTAREAVLFRFKYLQDLQKSQQEKAAGEDAKTPENILKEKLWVPCIGWFLFGGFAVNLLIQPFFEWVRPVDWSFLQASLGIFLTVSGTREVSIYAQKDRVKSAEAAESE